MLVTAKKKGQGVSTRGEATPDETISARRKQGVQNWDCDWDDVSWIVFSGNFSDSPYLRQGVWETYSAAQLNSFNTFSSEEQNLELMK